MFKYYNSGAFWPVARFAIGYRDVFWFRKVNTYDK